MERLTLLTDKLDFLGFLDASLMCELLAHRAGNMQRRIPFQLKTSLAYRTELLLSWCSFRKSLLLANLKNRIFGKRIFLIYITVCRIYRCWSGL